MKEGGRVEPRRFTAGRTRFFRAVEATLTVLGGRFFYRWRYLDPGRVAVRREVVGVRGLAPELDGFTIAAISDLHGGPFVGPGDLAHVASLVEAESPDVVALLGDYVVHSVDEFERVGTDVARIARAARDGAFAVFGNHDYKSRREAEIAAALPDVRFLRNAAQRVQRGRGAVTFVGIEDAEEARVLDVAAARREVRTGDVEVVLSHNPGAVHAFVAPPAQADVGARLVLAGHTHGTQVDLPILRSLGPAHPGLRVELADTTLLVSRGVGALGVPLRVGAPAEVLVVRLVRPIETPEEHLALT